LDALIFDFDGVVVDSEPIHLVAFQRTLRAIGVELTKEDYYGKYLGYDDHDCFAAVIRDQGRATTEGQLQELTSRKTVMVKQAFKELIQPMPGAVALVRGAFNARVPLAICSGALREEIELACRAAGIWECFTVIVAARDVGAGKPDPQGYLLTLERLRAALGKALAATRCVVFEDAPAGIAAAKAAGMKVVAVTNSYDAGALGGADRVVKSLEDVDIESLRKLL